MPNPYVWTLLLAGTPLALAGTPEPVVVISLSDTTAQKAKVARTVPTPVTSTAEPSEPGFMKRTIGRWLSSDEASSTAEASTAERIDPKEARRLANEQRDLARNKGKDKDQSLFNDHFRKYTKHYFGMGTDWRWFQAQAMVESEMKPHVRSNSGAMGLMQIMPRTFQEIRSRNPAYADPFDPHYNIAAGIYYNRQLYKAWSHVEDENDRRKFMFASYNAGLGNVKRAAKRVGNPVDYKVLESALSAEPKRYVVKIERERRKIDD